MAENNIKKIAVLGAESTGKTWLCESLAGHYKTVWVPEYAREYFNGSDIYNYSLDDLEIIAKKQLELEAKIIKKARDFIFCDTTLITLKIWAELEFSKVPAFIEERLQKSTYDHFFLTDNAIDWVEDSLRQNKFSRDIIFKMNLSEIIKSGIPYSVATGQNDERLQNAVKLIEHKILKGKF